MKKILIISILAFGLIGLVQSQDRTVTKAMQSGYTYYKYSGAAADTLTANQDTIDFVLTYAASGWVKKLAVKTRFDVIDGADTTVSTSVFGKEFDDDDTYVQVIGASLSSDVSANNTVQILTSDYTETFGAYNSTEAAYNSVAPAYLIVLDSILTSAGTNDTLFVDAVTVANASHILANAAQTVTPFDRSYRVYRIRYIISGDDHVGEGIKIDEIEVKFYTD
jgi:hypothetical protein